MNPPSAELDFDAPRTLNDPRDKVHLIEETFQRLMFGAANYESLI